MVLTGCAVVLTLASGAGTIAQQPPRPQEPPKGVRLETLAWPEAEPLLRADTVVVLPIGAAAKEHGPHLQLRNDLTMADYLTARVVDASAVVVAPTLTYHFYPAFTEYPGSTTLTAETARSVTVDAVRSLARFGPKRFYALNTGISTVRPLEAAAKVLAAEGILLGFTNLNTTLEATASKISQQTGGSHADEIETSMMLYIDPSVVDMTRAVKDYRPSTGVLRLTRQPNAAGTYSPSGIWGDPTLATRDKGQQLVEALVSGILGDIETLRRAALPAATESRDSVTASERSMMPGGGPSAGPRTCTPGDERLIRQIGDAFTLHWNNADAKLLGALWTDDGDMIHPDGLIERTRQTIIMNRTEMFTRREYRGSRHPMRLTMIRCVGPDAAVADGKWELRNVGDSKGGILPTFEGQVTLVVKREAGWRIDAYRYTLKPAAVAPPTFLKRPGWPDKPGG
jgi:creatinine amidohydrolase